MIYETIPAHYFDHTEIPWDFAYDLFYDAALWRSGIHKIISRDDRLLRSKRRHVELFLKLQFCEVEEITTVDALPVKLVCKPCHVMCVGGPLCS